MIFGQIRRQFERLGRIGLIATDFAKEFAANRFLVVPPGQMTTESYDARILRAVPTPAEARTECG